MIVPLRQPLLAAVAVGVLAIGAVACGSDGAQDQVSVSAAASLTDAFGEIAAAYTDSTGTDVVLNLGGSAVLAEQILRGAPVDVFASADSMQMSRVEAVMDRPTGFAANELVLISASDSAEPVGRPQDLLGLANAGEITALCAPKVPCGRLADEVLQASGVDLPEEQVTRESNVRAVLRSVATGDAAAGFVYATDAELVGDTVDVAELDAGLSASTEYQIVAADSKGQPFLDFVSSEVGQQILARWGFAP